MTDTMVLIPSDYVRQLVDDFWTHERPEGWDRRYFVGHRALLDQLEDTLTGSTKGSDPVRIVAGSRPAGRIDVLAFLERIQSQSLKMAEEMGIPPMPLRARLLRIAGELGLSPDPVVRSWWVTARVLTSFDSPAYVPNVPCPNEECERRGSLRVKVGDREDQRQAVCVECHWVWDGPYFGVFAEWVRWASEHLGSGHSCVECASVHAAMKDRALQTPKERYASSRR